MPTFGDYETVGEPLAVINLQGHSSTVWKVQKHGAPTGTGARVEWVVKCYSPHRKSQAGGDEQSLNRDRGLEFLEGIKQLKKVQSEGGRHLTPIHDLGISPEGVWYVTDHYPRSSLQALIGRRAKVDGAALKQIIRCIVAGCLVLKRSRGYAHGNLKASNVFLCGKPRPLPQTSMVLADPYPSAPLQLARLDAEDRRGVDELLYQVMEVQDIHALGEIILQLVERRQIRSGYDYNYPIARSDFWDGLGKEGESWRQICNQLLDPQLSLAKTNFESLAKKFPAPASGNKVMVTTCVVLAICLVGGGVYGYAAWNTKHHQQKCNDCIQAAQQALQNGDFPGAKQKIADALSWEPDDKDALSWKEQIKGRIDQEYSSAVASAEAKFKAAHLDQALEDLNKAFSLKPDGVEAGNLKAAIEQVQQSATNKETQEQRYQSAMQSGQTAYDQGDYSAAVKAAEAALAARRDDPAATRLESNARAEIDELGRQGQQYQSVIQSGQAAYAQGNYSAAVKAADAALAARRHDPAANALKTDAEGKIAELRHAQEQYDLAVKQGQADFASGDYAGASKQAAVALAMKVADTGAAQNLQSEAGEKLGVLQQTQQQYDSVVKQGQADFASGDYAGASKQAVVALAMKVADTSGAQNLQSEAADRLEAQQRTQAEYDSAVKQGQTDFASGDYAGASKQAAAALAVQVADTSAAQKLQTAAADKLEAQQRTQQQYDSAVKQGQADFASGDYTGAGKQAAAALALQVADTSAAQKLQTAAADKLEAQQRTQAEYDSAVKQGQTDFASGDYAGASKQAAAALAVQVADTSAAQKLQTAAADKLEAQQRTQQQYDSAVKQGQADFASGDYTGAGKQAATALAMNVPDHGAAERLKAQVGEAIVEANDFQTAEKSLEDCDYQNALDTCRKHAGVSKFDDLRTNISAQQGAFEGATKELDAGNYSFIQELQRDYGANDCFKGLLTQAKTEEQVFNNLEKLTNNPSNWTLIKNILNAQSNAGITQKDGFKQFRDWAKQNDPEKILAAKLDAQLSLFEVWFGIKDPDASVIDPYNNNRTAAKMAPGVVPDSIYTLLSNLKTGYMNLGGDQSVHLKAIENIKDKMDNWDN